MRIDGKSPPERESGTGWGLIGPFDGSPGAQRRSACSSARSRSGSALSVLFAAYLVWSAAARPPRPGTDRLRGALAWTLVCAARRLRSPNPEGGLGSTSSSFCMVVVAYAVVLVPGSLDGPGYAIPMV